MAITDYYVSDTGAGANTGADAANALTWSQMVTQINGLGAGGGAGRRYNYAGSTARTTSTDLITVGGTAASPLIIRGCSSLSTIVDGNQGRTNDNGALVTANFGVVTYTSGRMSVASYTIVENLDISATSLNNFMLDVAVNSIVHHSKLAISGTGGGSSRAVRLDGAGASLIDCDCENTCTTSAGAVLAASSGNRLVGCRVTSTNSAAVVVASTYSQIVGNVIYNSTTGISFTSTAANGVTSLVYGNTIYNCSAEGILLPNAVGADDIPVVVNNHIQDCGQSLDSGYAATADLPIWWSYNRTDNTSADDGFDDWKTASDVGNITTATATEYVNAGAGDFNLSDGVASINAGFPKFSSMGALQKELTAGGGPLSGPGRLIRN